MVDTADEREDLTTKKIKKTKRNESKKYEFTVPDVESIGFLTSINRGEKSPKPSPTGIIWDYYFLFFFFLFPLFFLFFFGEGGHSECVCLAPEPIA